MNPESVRSGGAGLTEPHAVRVPPWERRGQARPAWRAGGGAVRAAGGGGLPGNRGVRGGGLDLAVMIPHVCKWAKNHQTVCFKRVNLMLCELHPNF